VGLVLTTQNPADLDYKGLTNAGTWFIGKLQTDRDKMRVLEGLEDVNTSTGAASARSYFDRLISSLDKRVFILHNVHQDQPVVFMTRWAMSYLRGPLTKSQIRILMEPYKEQLAATTARHPVGEGEPTLVATVQTALPQTESGFSSSPPRLRSDIPQYFLQVDTPLERAVRGEERHRGVLLEPTRKQKAYQPAILGWATVHFQDPRRKVAHSEEHCYLLAVPEDLAWVDWRKGRVALGKDDLLDYNANARTYGKCRQLIQSFEQALGTTKCREIHENVIFGRYYNTADVKEGYPSFVRDKGFEKCGLPPGIGARIAARIIIEDMEKSR